MKKFFLRRKISSAKKALDLARRANNGDKIAIFQLKMAGVPVPVPSHYMGNLKQKIAKLEKEL